jgi:hypothetical protein
MFVTQMCCNNLPLAVACLQALSLPKYNSFDKLGIDDVGARNALREVSTASS